MSNDPNQTGQQGSEQPVKRPDESDQDFRQRLDEWRDQQKNKS